MFAARTQSPGRPAPDTSRTGSSRNGAGILVVDEDSAFRLGLKTFLREYVGFERVFAADNGRAALELIQSESSIDLLTLDYRMPGTTGIELLQCLAETAPRTLGVIMITGYPSEELEAEFRARGTSRLLTTHFLTKPLDFEKLEPLLLRAHDDVLAARRAAGESGAGDAAASSAPGSTEERLARIDATLAEHSRKLDQIHGEVATLRRKWRVDFWLLVLVAALVWLALHFDVLERLQPVWEDFETGVSIFLENVTGEPSPAPSAPDDGGVSPGTDGPPNAGDRPL